MRRREDMQWAKAKLFLASALFNVFVVATFLTSSPKTSPASTWITALDKTLYKVGIKSSSDLKALHLNSSNLSKEECVACHGNMFNSKVQLHKLHLTSELLPGLQCNDCHDRIELGGKSNVKVVHEVNVGFCKKCHSPFPGLNPVSPMKPTDAQADCKTCHSGKHTFRHAQPYLSQVIASQECYGCHGGRVLPTFAEHENDDWIQQHGKYALNNTEPCMKCHGYGLEFCKQCHSKKPPSHYPVDNWRHQHGINAQRDTNVCFACHDPQTFCKKCHIGHTPNWRSTHWQVVMANGMAPCVRCHSATFCEGCHTKVAAGKLKL
ncbi:MAG: hypothetical protein M1335_01350 [Chloroflexi bacterium]|nr:hypothetical protein [Chloroflexota bacterium]